MMASKSQFLKQHKTVLKVSPGALHVNLNIDYIVYTKFSKERFCTTQFSVSGCSHFVSQK